MKTEQLTFGGRLTADVNGATTTRTVQFGFDPAGKPDAAALNAAAAKG